MTLELEETMFHRWKVIAVGTLAPGDRTWLATFYYREHAVDFISHFRFPLTYPDSGPNLNLDISKETDDK